MRYTTSAPAEGTGRSELSDYLARRGLDSAGFQRVGFPLVKPMPGNAMAPALGLLGSYPFSAPYEDVRLKSH